MSNTIKLRLYEQCIAFIEQRIANAQQAMNNATESGNDETKSSAGDKHETGRAMAQLEQEKSAKQLNAAIELKNELSKIDPAQQSKEILVGSLVYTNNGNFYISIAAGKLIIDQQSFFAVSPTTPIAACLKGLKIGGKTTFNGQSYTIENIL